MFGIGPAFTGFGPVQNGGSGLSVLLPTGGREGMTLFGLSLGVGYLLRKHLEPIVLIDFTLADTSMTTGTASVSAGLKLNAWLGPRFNPFAEADAGVFEYFAGGWDSVQMFRGGATVGCEWLFAGNWGIHLRTGIVVLYYREEAMYEIPVRWGFAGFF
jgi:hypothetical protein